jgi:ABC-type multidrug transport system ATPase subunit
MDEPYSGLDVERSASLSGIIRLLAERGRTVLFSCHEESIIRAMADRFILIRDGMAECSPIRDMPFMAAESLAGKEALPWLS